jgi:hypothetical protein
MLYAVLYLEKRNGHANRGRDSLALQVLALDARVLLAVEIHLDL